MKLVPESSPLPRVLALLYLSLAAAGALVLAAWPDLVVRWARCPWRAATGWPCLTCGGTHAAVALVRLRLADAFRCNPLVAAGAVTLVGWGCWGAISAAVPAWRKEVRLSRRERRALRIGCVLLLLGGWLYQIVRAAPI
jgi:hypothetical protein